ncbi:hypothetical protein R5R35_008451 [Gryllus longicercus]|uniref:Globin domain-containing protein n=1 Tax=Gryllus longicercus TaxID=2509291 RepID=A0AAN9VHU8_9ORTH
MGIILSYLSYLWNGDAGAAAPAIDWDRTDPATGLTARQKKFVTDTWELVKKDIKGNGVELFIRFFERRPDAVPRFRSFVGVPLEELRHSKRLLAHTNSVMYALDSVVASLDDPECLHEMLLKMGENHGRRRVTEQEFLDLKVVLMDLLKDKLDIHLNEEGEEAWSKTIDVAYKGIFEGMKSEVVQ